MSTGRRNLADHVADLSEDLLLVVAGRAAGLEALEGPAKRLLRERWWAGAAGPK